MQCSVPTTSARREVGRGTGEQWGNHQVRRIPGWDVECGIWDLGFGIWNLGCRMWNLASGSWSLGSGI